MRGALRARGNELIVLFSIVGFLLSVTQIFGQSPDYDSYSDFFDLIRTEGLDVIVVSRFEPGFSFFAFLLASLLTTNVIVYSWIVAGSMLLKGWVINVYSSSKRIFIVVAVFYLARYFSLHELTQLRAACAIGLMLAGSVFFWRGNTLIGVFAFALALAFHMSSAAVIPALFFPPTKRWQVVSIAFLVFILVSVFAGPISVYLANLIMVFDSYQSGGFGDHRPNPFSIQLLIDWAMIFTSLLTWKRLSMPMRRVVFLELIGMAIFYGGIEFPVVAHRIREFISVFWVFLVADGLRLKSTRTLCYGFVVVCILFYSYLFFISRDFFN